jgi:hypothetical protein
VVIGMGGKRWTSSEILFLKENYSHLTNEEISKVLNKSVKSVELKAHRLELKKESFYWSNKDVEVLRKNQDKTIQEIHKLIPHKTKATIRTKMINMGLSYKLESDSISEFAEKVCIKCGEIKSLKDFKKRGKNKGNVCKKCDNKYSVIKEYKKHGIVLEIDRLYDTYTPIEWYEFYRKGVITQLPKNAFDKKKIIQIIRYVLEKYNNVKSRKDVLNIKHDDIKSNKIYSLSRKLGNHLSEILIKTFPEYNLSIYDFNELPNNYLNNKKNLDDYMRYYINKVKCEFNLTDEDLIRNVRYYVNQKMIRFMSCSSLAHRLYDFYNSYYEWINELYPEWNLKPEDFNTHISKNNLICNSLEEKRVCDFLFDNFNLNIKTTFSNKNSFKFYNKKLDESYIPDFIIEDFDKPIIIEYYGLFKANGDIGKEYTEKVHRKNQYYRSRFDICFVDLYPEDLRNNCEGVRKKMIHLLKTLRGGEWNKAFSY